MAMHRIYLFVLLILCATKIGAEELRFSGYTMALPPFTTTMWVLRDAKLNGVKTQMVSLKFNQSLEAVVDHFSGQLDRNGEFHQSVESGDLRVLSQSLGRRFLTLQLSSKERFVTGVLTVSDDYLVYYKNRFSTFHLPPGFSVLNHIDDSLSETITLISRQSLNDSVQSIRSALNGIGWRVQRQSAGHSTNSMTLFFVKGRSIARVFAANEESFGNQTLTYINFSKS